MPLDKSELVLRQQALQSQVGSLEQRGQRSLSEAEALQLESLLSVSRVLLLLSEQLSPSDTASAPQG